MSDFDSQLDRHFQRQDDAYYDEPEEEHQVEWTCPACGNVRVTLRKPLELVKEAERRIIKDHIEEGCGAY